MSILTEYFRLMYSNLARTIAEMGLSSLSMVRSVRATLRPAWIVWFPLIHVGMVFGKQLNNAMMGTLTIWMDAPIIAGVRSFLCLSF